MNASIPPLLSFPFSSPPRPGEAREVAPGVLWLRMPLPFALDHINLWLLADGDGWTQIDCGYGNPATRALWEEHFAVTLSGRRLLRVIATHFHPDHLGNGAWLTQRFGCPLVMPQAEFLTAHAISGEHSGYPVAAFVALFRGHGLEPEHGAALEARGNQYRRGVPELPSVYQRLMPGAEVAIGEFRWRVLNGYGHSPEHAALFCERLGVCISGDMLLPTISTNISVPPVEPDADPLARFLDSLSAFAGLPPETRILPSHGLPFVGAGLRVDQLRAHHAARLAELEAAANPSAVTAADVVPVLFRRELDIQQRFFAMGEAIAHLNHLWRAGRLTRTTAADGTFRFTAARRLQ
ncbi:MAG TPA: MBL fold metallo-hydrolase [Casimicrobiaceae bacterium]|nr:MBL fold metallo-hydrolase [Casimicrobiaceae bacterium]